MWQEVRIVANETITSL